MFRGSGSDCWKFRSWRSGCWSSGAGEEKRLLEIQGLEKWLLELRIWGREAAAGVEGGSCGAGARLPRSNSLSISFSTAPAGEAAAPSPSPGAQAWLAAEQSRPFLPRTHPNNLFPVRLRSPAAGCGIPAALPSLLPLLLLLRGAEGREGKGRGPSFLPRIPRTHPGRDGGGSSPRGCGTGTGAAPGGARGRAGSAAPSAAGDRSQMGSHPLEPPRGGAALP